MKLLRELGPMWSVVLFITAIVLIATCTVLIKISLELFAVVIVAALISIGLIYLYAGRR